MHKLMIQVKKFERHQSEAIIFKSQRRRTIEIHQSKRSKAKTYRTVPIQKKIK